MALTGEEVRANLTRFVARWSVRDGYEKGEAQLFLGDLFACYGQDLAEVASFEQFQDGGFIDLIWPRVCIFEMKSASEAKRLDRHRDQAQGAVGLHGSLLDQGHLRPIWAPDAWQRGGGRSAARHLSRGWMRPCESS